MAARVVQDFYRKKHQLPKYTLERFVELMFHHCPNLQASAQLPRSLMTASARLSSVV